MKVLHGGGGLPNTVYSQNTAFFSHLRIPKSNTIPKPIFKREYGFCARLPTKTFSRSTSKRMAGWGGMNRPSRTDDTSRFDTPHFVALRTSNSTKSHHHASASSTASLMGNSQQRPRITRKAAPVTAMARVRKAIRGVSALSNWYELRSVFHRDGSIGSSDVVADLSVEAFWLRLRDLGCSDDDIAEVAGSFDPTRCGSMSTKELFAVLTSPMWRIDPSIKVQ